MEASAAVQRDCAPCFLAPLVLVRCPCSATLTGLPHLSPKEGAANHLQKPDNNTVIAQTDLCDSDSDNNTPEKRKTDHAHEHQDINRWPQQPRHENPKTAEMTALISPPHYALHDTIRLNRFFSLDETTLLQQIKEAFPSELERLKCAVAVERSSPPSQPYANKKPTPSEILYNENFDEINRTMVGVLALRWIWTDDYNRFTTGQPESVRLHYESFEWLRDLFRSHLITTDDLFLLVVSMIINDLGKDPNLEQDYYGHTNVKLAEQNHDSILLEAAQAGMIPCLELLSETQRSDLMLGLELGSELNAGQLAQAESVPINLEFLLEMKGREHAFELKFLEQILDVAGAAAHADASGARNLIEPVFEAFKTVHEVSREIIAGKLNLRQGYDKVLTKRGNMLSVKGFRRLSVSNREERALLRILTMGRTADRDRAELFQQAFHALDPRSKEFLVTGLNIDGNENETAVLPYYMPAMFSEALETTKDESENVRRRALTSLMRYLAKVLNSSSSSPMSTVPEEPQLAPVPGIVIEHNMMKAREVIGSSSFRTNPDALDELDIPQGQLLQRRRTSHSL